MLILSKDVFYYLRIAYGTPKPVTRNLQLEIPRIL